MSNLNTSKTGYFLDFKGDPADYSWIINNTKTNLPMAEIPNSGNKKYRDALRKSVNIGSFFEISKTPNTSGSGDSKKPSTFYPQVWTYIKNAKNNDINWNSYTDDQLADLILGTGDPDEYKSGGTLELYKGKGAFLYPDDWLKTSEGKTDTTHAGYAFWAQDIELDNSINENIDSTTQKLNTNALDSYAGIVAVLWAGRQKLGKDFQIVPVTSKSINVNLLYDPSKGYMQELINLESVYNEVIDYLPSALKNGYFKENIVPDTTVIMNDGSENQIARTSWNFMSLLKHNEIIDGFISQRYTQEDVLTKRTIQMNPVAACYEPSTVKMPYALQGAINNPAELPNTPTASPLFEIDYNKGIGMNSAMYFSPKGMEIKDIQKLAQDFDPSNYFKPKENNLMSHNASVHQIREKCIIDMSTLPLNSNAFVQVNLSREAVFSSYVGFYKITDSDGSVIDPISGATIKPGDQGYQDVALKAANSIDDLSKVLLKDNGSTNRAATTGLNGGILMAPYAVVEEGGIENTFFSFSAANADGINHFKVLSKNKFGMEDIFGGGDLDYNDLIIDFQFVHAL